MRDTIVRFLVLFICLFFIAACTNKNNSDSNNVADETTFSADNKFPQRIITLSPHLTELVYSLGAQKHLVATVAYSDYPEAAKNIPRIGDAFRIDWEQLAKLNPDLILAWQNGNPQNLLDELEHKDYPLLALKNPGLSELPGQLQSLAKRLGALDKVVGLVDAYSIGIEQLKQTYSSKKTIKVFYQISPEPLYTVNGAHVISEMLNVCGAHNIFGGIGNIAAPVSVEALLEASPDVILTTDEMLSAVIENWSHTGMFKPENILSVPPDEVARASLRMLQGTQNICEALDEWRANQARN